MGKQGSVLIRDELTTTIFRQVWRSEAQYFLRKAESESDAEMIPFYFIEFAARETLVELFETLRHTEDGRLEWPEHLDIRDVYRAIKTVIGSIAQSLRITISPNTIGTRADEILLDHIHPDEIAQGIATEEDDSTLR